MVDRVVLFIDYQNVYRAARTAFFDHEVDPHWRGQFDPLKLGNYLVADSPFERVLSQVRVYRGLPGSSQDPVGYSAARSQISVWGKDDRVVSVNRPLRYPEGWPNNSAVGAKPGEKGIDVQIAVDFVTMATREQFDVGILFSSDTDLKPALEFVSAPDIKARCEVASWKPLHGYGSRLSISSKPPYCHWIDWKSFQSVQDETNYSRR